MTKTLFSLRRGPAYMTTADWPDPTPEQVEVVLLGMYHMDNPGLDEVNPDADDVLVAERQAELDELVDGLTAADPDLVAVERPHDWADAVADLYRRYRDGDLSFAEPADIDPPHPERDDPTAECRSEVVQVGFRLAARLGHDRVAAIDEHPASFDDAFADREVDSTPKTAADRPDPEAVGADLNELIATCTVPEIHAAINADDPGRANHALMFDRGLRLGEGQFGTPSAIAHWYDRNIRMVHHTWRAMDEDTDRILLLVGSGHVPALRHLFDQAPMFCPRSPLPYLPDPP